MSGVVPASGIHPLTLSLSKGEPVHDVVVVGGGVAGLTAALFSARHGRSTLALIPLMPGGHLATIDHVEDFPGFPGGVAGYELGPAIQQQAQDYTSAILCRVANERDILGLADERAAPLPV